MSTSSVLVALFIGLSAATTAVAQTGPAATRLGGTQLAASTGNAKPAKVGAFNKTDDVAAFVNGYRSNPQPQRLAQLFRAMGDLGLLADTETSGLYLGFIGGMLTADPANASAIIGRLFPLKPEYHAALIKAIAYSGLPQWRELLHEFAERMPARVVLIDRFMTGRMTALDALKLDDGPVPLDVMWGNYFATGSFEPIMRLVSVLSWSNDANDVERLTIGSMAKWTLASNASSDADLLRLLKATVGSETKATQRLLTEVIAAAETGEIAKIRKGALTAIDQLRAKGPANTRTAAWWGQAGQMALSLGCVAASAMGAAATIGIPCVIGGAASTAAIKMMTSPQ